MDLNESTRTYTIMKDYIGIYRNTSMNIYTYEKIYIAYIYITRTYEKIYHNKNNSVCTQE